MNEEPEEDESTEARFRRVQEELRALELPEMPDDEVDARLSAIHARPVGALPSFDDHLDSLERRTQGARNVHHRAMNAEPARRESDHRATKGLGVGLAIAYALIGLPLVGLGLGYLLSRFVGGPWIAIGAVAGFVGGIAFALYLNRRESARL